MLVATYSSGKCRIIHNPYGPPGPAARSCHSTGTRAETAGATLLPPVTLGARRRSRLARAVLARGRGHVDC